MAFYLNLPMVRMSFPVTKAQGLAWIKTTVIYALTHQRGHRVPLLSLSPFHSHSGWCQSVSPFDQWPESSPGSTDYFDRARRSEPHISTSAQSLLNHVAAAKHWNLQSYENLQTNYRYHAMPNSATFVFWLVVCKNWPTKRRSGDVWFAPMCPL